MYYFFLLIGIINFLFIYYYNKISIIYNLFDHPNEERKKQSFPVPLLGGIYFLLNFIFYCFYELNFGSWNFFYTLGFINNINIFVFITSILLFFFLGFIDDKINLKPLLDFRKKEQFFEGVDKVKSSMLEWWRVDLDTLSLESTNIQIPAWILIFDDGEKKILHSRNGMTYSFYD